MSSVKQKMPSTQEKWDIRVSSPRKLLRTLHDLLSDHGYEHSYEPLRSERDAISDMAIFKSELIGRRESRERNKFRRRIGIILMFTIFLIPLALHLIRSSSYSLRTISRIGVEGESYRARLSEQGTTQREELEIVSDARVTLDIKTGLVDSNYGMLRPLKRMSELTRFEEEQVTLKDNVVKRLKSLELPPWTARGTI